MSTSDSSTSARRDGSARDAVENAAHDITDAIEALRITAAFDEHDDLLVDAYGEVPLTFGQARAILAALSAPYVPGMQAATPSVWAESTGPVAKLSLWADSSTHRDDLYFAAPAVTE